MRQSIVELHALPWPNRDALTPSHTINPNTSKQQSAGPRHALVLGPRGPPDRQRRAAPALGQQAG